jgi:hypothetical protein
MISSALISLRISTCRARIVFPSGSFVKDLGRSLFNLLPIPAARITAFLFPPKQQFITMVAFYWTIIYKNKISLK